MSPVWILKRLVSVFINACRLLSALPSLSQFGWGRMSLVVISFYDLSLLFGPCRLSEFTLAGPHKTKPLVYFICELRTSTKILVLGSQLCTRIWVYAMIGSLKKPLFNWPITLMRIWNALLVIKFIRGPEPGLQTLLASVMSELVYICTYAGYNIIYGQLVSLLFG